MCGNSTCNLVEPPAAVSHLLGVVPGWEFGNLCIIKGGKYLPNRLEVMVKVLSVRQAICDKIKFPHKCNTNEYVSGRTLLNSLNDIHNYRNRWRYLGRKDNKKKNLNRATQWEYSSVPEQISILRQRNKKGPTSLPQLILRLLRGLASSLSTPSGSSSSSTKRTRLGF